MEAQSNEKINFCVNTNLLQFCHFTVSPRNCSSFKMEHSLSEAAVEVQYHSEVNQAASCPVTIWLLIA